MFTACPQLVSHMNLVMSHYHISFPCSLQCKTRCVFGWGQFSMGDAVLPCQSLLLLFLSVCRGILDEPQLGCFWHWRSWDLDSGCSAQVPWHVIHTLFSNLHWGSEGFLPPGGNTRFRAQHSLWVAGGRWSFPVEPFHCSPMYNPFISFFIHREGCCLFTSYQKGSRGERQEAFAPALCCPLVLAGYAIPTCHPGSCWSLSPVNVSADEPAAADLLPSFSSDASCTFWPMFSRGCHYTSRPDGCHSLLEEAFFSWRQQGMLRDYSGKVRGTFPKGEEWLGAELQNKTHSTGTTKAAEQWWLLWPELWASTA